MVESTTRYGFAIKCCKLNTILLLTFYNLLRTRHVMAKKKRTGPPKKKASERFKSITVTMPPEMYRDAKRHTSVSQYLREIWQDSKLKPAKKSA